MHVNGVCEQNVKFLSVQPDDIYTILALKCDEAGFARWTRPKVRSQFLK